MIHSIVTKYDLVKVYDFIKIENAGKIVDFTF